MSRKEKLPGKNSRPIVLVWSPIQKKIGTPKEEPGLQPAEKKIGAGKS